MNSHARRRQGDFIGALCAAISFPLVIVGSLPAAASDNDARMAMGREIFTKAAEPPCGLCHTLRDAGTTGEIGAKLEEIKPDPGRVAEAVRKGLGIMPSYAGKLSETQIEAVAHYVSLATASAR